MTEIAGALISIVLVLLAVFLPVAFLGGVTGTLYKQFAITIAISMVISGIMALTLSPALAAIIIKAHHGEKNRFFRGLRERLRARAQRLRRRRRRDASGPGRSRSSCSARVIAGILLMFRILPSSFVPDEDQGYFFVVAQVPDTASLRGHRALHRRRWRRSCSRTRRCRTSARSNGYSFIDGQIRTTAPRSCSRLLKPFEERKDASLLSFDTLKRLNAQFSGIARRRRVRAQPAVDSRPGHHRRLRVLRAEPRLGRSARHRRGGQGVPRQGARSGRSCRASTRPSAPRASSCSSISTATRPRCSACTVRRRVPGDAGVLRLAGRRPVLAVQPRLVGDPAGRRQLPRQAGGLRQGVSCARRAAPTSRSRR